MGMLLLVILEGHYSYISQIVFYANLKIQASPQGSRDVANTQNISKVSNIVDCDGHAKTS